RLDDCALDDHPARRGALLARREERAARDLLGGEVEIGVGENDRRVLAAELELHLLPVCDALDLHAAPDLVAAGERDRVDVACYEIISDLGSSSEHEVEHAVR